MDRIIVYGQGKATISNDGATMMKLLDIIHPTAKTLVDIAKSQDAEFGDGYSTTSVLLAGKFLKQTKPFVEEGVHPRIIIKAMGKALTLCIEKLTKWLCALRNNFLGSTFLYDIQNLDTQIVSFDRYQ